MLKINLVPDDYIQSNATRRANLMCLVLFVPVMAVLVGLFVNIKIQQRVLVRREGLLDTKMSRANEAIKQFERLQAKRNSMWKRALTTAELLEPVSRSILLASLTNNLPAGVSLLQLSAIQKEPSKSRAQANWAVSSKYKNSRSKRTSTAGSEQSREKRLRIHIGIEGIAPSDIEVASYIERLGSSKLLEDVALVESKEHKVEDTTFRQFRLTAMLKKDVHLSDEDVDKIRAEL